MNMECIEVAFSLDAAGGGTVQTKPLFGRVVQVRIPKDSPWTVGGSADLTITRASDGGTVAAVSNAPTAGVDYTPTVGAQTVTAGTTSYATGQGPVPAGGVPVAGHLNVAVLQGALSAAGTAFIYIES